MGALIFDGEADLCWSSPMNRIGDDLLNVGVIEGAAGLVTGLEVEYLSCTTVEASTASEDVSVLIPTDEEKSVRLGNIERLGIDLFGFDEEVIRETCTDGVTGIYVPHDLLLNTTPLEVAVSSDDSLEGLGVVTRVESDEAHLTEVNSLLDPCNELILDFLVETVTPPNKNVGVFEDLIGKTLTFIIKSGESYGDLFVLLEKFTDGCVETVGVEFFCFFFLLFMSEFVPYSDFNHSKVPPISLGLL